MSIWYQYEITVLSDKNLFGKIFNLGDKDITIDNLSFDLSFGQKNVPGISFEKIAENYPGVILLVTQYIESEFVSKWIMRYSKDKSDFELVHIESFYGDEEETCNNLLIEEYFSKFRKHKKNVPLNWKLFFDFQTASAVLDNVDKYQNIVHRAKIDNLDYENSDLEKIL